jgi:predicted metal-dependent hydrolase
VLKRDREQHDNKEQAFMRALAHNKRTLSKRPVQEQLTDCCGLRKGVSFIVVRRGCRGECKRKMRGRCFLGDRRAALVSLTCEVQAWYRKVYKPIHRNNRQNLAYAAKRSFRLKARSLSWPLLADRMAGRK